MWGACADKGEMAVVRKHIEAGVTAVKKVKEMEWDDEEEMLQREKEVNALTLATENAAKAMVEAAKKGDMAVVRKQLKAGVAVDMKVGEYEETALHKAAEGKQTKMSKFLVTRGADTNAKDGWERTGR